MAGDEQRVTAFSVSKGLADHHREAAGRLFWQAFRGKLGFALGPDEKALDFLERAMGRDTVLCALSETGDLVGVAGFKTPQGGFVGGSLKDLGAVYGPWGGVWRGALLSLLERACEPGVLLMDGIFVAEAGRGQGVGSALLAAVEEHARAAGLSQVRLDVIDTNPRARALYERHGFKAGGTQSLGVLRHVFGFASATTMTKAVAAAPAPSL